MTLWNPINGYSIWHQTTFKSGLDVQKHSPITQIHQKKSFPTIAVHFKCYIWYDILIDNF